ncbi:hypothetical protein [Moorena sp. SIO4G3]|uniref:hypothetical protein n=1 Tax=Moorena sp. SIO4G3 TaxID=2607821 RepID=UPI00142AD677|nr:hypothetical protein [Moorena sp. SIO4G3]NEO79843.1 hypothetical protein [Moorena sp. SIO4G3]
MLGFDEPHQDDQVLDQSSVNRNGQAIAISSFLRNELFRYPVRVTKFFKSLRSRGRLGSDVGYTELLSGVNYEN